MHVCGIVSEREIDEVSVSAHGCVFVCRCASVSVSVSARTSCVFC